MRKEKRFIAVICILCMVFSACGGKVEQLNTGLSVYASEDTQYDLSNYTNVMSTYKETHEVGATFYQLAADATIDENAAQAALKTALAGGGGPDIVFGECWGQDAEKLAASGIFYDMNSLLEQDKSFNLDKGYQTKVIEKGVLHGKRFIMPLLFSVATFNSTEEILSQSSFQGLLSYDCKTFCEYANEFLDANPQMALFNNTTTQYRAIVQSMFSHLNVETLKSDAFRKVIEVCRRNTQRQEELGINAEDLMRPYFAMESGKYLFYCGNDNQDLKLLGSFSSLGSPTYFTLSNESGTLNGDILFFASINAKSENLQNAWDFMKLLLTQYQDVAQYMPEAKRGTSMNGELGKSVLLSGNQGIVNQFQTFTPPLLNYLNEDNSLTQIPMAPVPEAVAQAYINLAQQVGEAYFNDTSAQVMSYFDAYIAGEKSYETCLEDAISYVTVHESE